MVIKGVKLVMMLYVFWKVRNKLSKIISVQSSVSAKINISDLSF